MPWQNERLTRKHPDALQTRVELLCPPQRLILSGRKIGAPDRCQKQRIAAQQYPIIKLQAHAFGGVAWGGDGAELATAKWNHVALSQRSKGKPRSRLIWQVECRIGLGGQHP